jgi:hypothetical protein
MESIRERHRNEGQTLICQVLERRILDARKKNQSERAIALGMGIDAQDYYEKILQAQGECRDFRYYLNGLCPQFDEGRIRLNNLRGDIKQEGQFV